MKLLLALALALALGACRSPAPRAAGARGAAAPSELPACVGCHEDTYEAARRAAHPHRAVVDGRCEACHVPHAPGGGPTTIRADACVTCHPARAVAGVHERHTVPPGRCTICHAGHGGAEPKLMRARAHDVLTECGSCHAGPDALDPFERTAAEPDLCTQCHDHAHALDPRPACTTCHDPHMPVRIR